MKRREKHYGLGYGRWMKATYSLAKLLRVFTEDPVSHVSRGPPDQTLDVGTTGTCSKNLGTPCPVQQRLLCRDCSGARDEMGTSTGTLHAAKVYAEFAASLYHLRPDNHVVTAFSRFGDCTGE
jgi:hypothetical protein